MSYCPYCGKAVTADMSFCPSCGSSLSSEIRMYDLSNTLISGSGDYRVYLIGIETGKKEEIADLLEDVLGYTALSADNLVANVPVQIAANLSLKQAAVIAQAFEEYGAELSVTNGEETEDISAYTSASSLFNSDGSFLASAAMILATLSAANRLKSINKPKKPSLLERVFHSLFNVPEKHPVHVRRSITPRPKIRVKAPEPERKIVRQKLQPAKPRQNETFRRHESHDGKPQGGTHGRR